MALSDQSIIVARERFADLLREAEHERRLNALRPPHVPHSSHGALGPSQGSHRFDHLRAITGIRPAPLASCAA